MNVDSSITGSTLRLTASHKVSADGWIVRTYVEDVGLGFVVRDRAGELWLVSVAELLAPEPISVRTKARSQGGPPIDESKSELLKVTVGWTTVDDSESSIVLDSPKVLGDLVSGVSVVHLRPESELAELVNDRTLTAYDLSQFDSLYSGTDSDYVLRDVFVHDDDSLWDIHRPVALTSDPSGGFVGRSDLVALNVDLEPEQQGALVVSGKRFGATQCVGLATPLRAGQGVMVLSSRVTNVLEAQPAEASVSV